MRLAANFRPFIFHSWATHALASGNLDVVRVALLGGWNDATSVAAALGKVGEIALHVHIRELCDWARRCRREYEGTADGPAAELLRAVGGTSYRRASPHD